MRKRVVRNFCGARWRNCAVAGHADRDTAARCMIMPGAVRFPTTNPAFECSTRNGCRRNQQADYRVDSSAGACHRSGGDIAARIVGGGAGEEHL